MAKEIGSDKNLTRHVERYIQQQKQGQTRPLVEKQLCKHFRL